MSCPIAEIQERNEALVNGTVANDNDPWGRISQMQDECAAIMENMLDTATSMNRDIQALTHQLIERGRPDFTPMEADHS